ncbi:hypothetical protein VARIO8X_60444 [Burkholderiales bacterium 8X]|nr:hypothetical protein VARIO8X_60444 [Burkholderiales bacterium 8X]
MHGSMSDPNLYKNRSDKFTERMVKLLKSLMADEQASNEFRNVITKFIFRTVEERGIV